MEQMSNNQIPQGGLLDMVQQLIPGYSGKGVDDRFLKEMQRAGIGQPIRGEVENPREEVLEGGVEEPLTPQQSRGLLQILQQLLLQQQ